MMQEDHTAITSFAETFLKQNLNGDRYRDKILNTVEDGRYRLILHMNDLRQANNDEANNIIRNPRDYMVAFKAVADEIARAALDADASKKLLEKAGINIGFEGNLGGNAVSPRGLVASKLNHLVEVEGIVTKCSSVKPKLSKLVQFSRGSNKYFEKEYRDVSSISVGTLSTTGGGLLLPTSSIISSKDADGNPLETEHGLCIYEDHQTITLQEMPERAKVGQLPRSVEVVLEHDLVDRIKPGDRVLCVGIYRPLAAPIANNSSSGLFKSNLIACNISIIGQEVGAVRLTGDDVKSIRELSSKPNILELLSCSLCPSIFGHAFIKKALILQLLGGCEKNLDNGTHLRGDINMMLVGDPSTAKSQLLRAVLDIAPLAISTTGRGSSGVGLTAAVTTDGESRERRLEAGAMVLADRGIVCIDEFDKMGENDRVAIHEVMEQQTVTIAKAGIHASLNARCSVLAAANPVYGQYDRQRSPQANIGLPDSLLSRFDLLFVVLDTLDPSFDRTLSEHVIRSHQYRRPGTIMEPEPLNQVSSVSLEDAADASKATLVWQRGGRGSDSSFGDGREGDVLTKDFMRKYIHYAKSRREPDLTEGAMEQISTEYAKMRSKQTKRNLPVTARTLETIIRLSTASAKCRLSSSVEERDVTAGVELLNFVLYHDISGHNEDVSNDRKRPREAEEIFPQRALLHGANARVRHFLSQQQLAGTTEISVESLLQQLNENPDFDADPIDMGGLTAILEELNVENRITLIEGVIYLV